MLIIETENYFLYTNLNVYLATRKLELNISKLIFLINHYLPPQLNRNTASVTV